MIRRVAMTLACCLSLSASAEAYQFMGPRWPDAKFPIQWRLDFDGVDNIANATDKSEVVRATQTWTNLPCSKVAFAAPTDLPATLFATGADNSNRVYWVEGRTWEHGTSTLGVTIPIYYQTGEIIDADIEFNGFNYNWSTGSGNYCSNCTDVYSIALHELGHFFGLAHSNVAAAVMAPSYPGFPKQALNQDDIDAACSLYRQPDPGTGSQGSSCSLAADCQSGLECAKVVSGIANICTKLCGTGFGACPADYACLDRTGGGKACFPPTDSVGDLCKACGSGSDCASGICITTQDFQVCTRGCTAQQGCPTGYACASTGTRSVCAPQAGFCANNCGAGCPGGQVCATVSAGVTSCQFKDGGDGEPCPAGNCVAGYVCIEADTGGPACRKSCVPGGANSCPAADQQCAELVSGGGACFPTQGGSGRQGDGCSTTQPCAAGFWCLGSGNGIGQCLGDCSPVTKNCPGSLRCNAWPDGSAPAGSAGGYCYGVETQPTLADECATCGAGVACKAGLFCVSGANGNSCRRGCSSNTACASDSCETKAGITGFSGACRCGPPPNRKNEGEACAANEECADGMRCVDDASGAGKTCHVTCNPAAPGCGQQVCRLLDGANVCAVKIGGVDAGEDEPRTSPLGCGCGSTDPVAFAAFGAMAVGVAIRRRRRG